MSLSGSSIRDVSFRQHALKSLGSPPIWVTRVWSSFAYSARCEAYFEKSDCRGAFDLLGGGPEPLRAILAKLSIRSFRTLLTSSVAIVFLLVSGSPHSLNHFLNSSSEQHQCGLCSATWFIVPVVFPKVRANGLGRKKLLAPDGRICLCEGFPSAGKNVCRLEAMRRRPESVRRINCTWPSPCCVFMEGEI